MTPYSPADRLFRWLARYVERPVLRFLAPQPLLRQVFEVTGRLGGKLPQGMSRTRDSRGNLWFTPQGVAQDAPLILYLHGGGFTIGSPRTHAALVAHLAQAAGMRAVAWRYRLAPEHPFPAARTDVIAAYDHLVSQGQTPAAICGDSAGGCLALMVAQHARDSGGPTPKALGLIAPIADLSGDIAARFALAQDEILIPPQWPQRINRVYLRDQDPTAPEVSPLLGNLDGLPPTLIQAAREEALAADAHKLQAALTEVTLDLWPGLPHVWHLHAGYAPAANRALARMGAFLKDAAAR